jgi:hypothetical protein
MREAVNISLSFFILSLPGILISGCAGQKTVAESGVDQVKSLHAAPKGGEKKKAKKKILFAFFAESSARSLSKDICRDKARTMAEDKLRLMIADTLNPLLLQARKDHKLRKNLDRLRNTVFTTEILSVQQASEIEMVSRPSAEGGHHCQVTLGLAWKDLLRLIENECRKEKTLHDRVRKLPAFKKLKARAQQ